MWPENCLMENCSLVPDNSCFLVKSVSSLGGDAVKDGGSSVGLSTSEWTGQGCFTVMLVSVLERLTSWDTLCTSLTHGKKPSGD